jgi:hypothetical protein
MAEATPADRRREPGTCSRLACSFTQRLVVTGGSPAWASRVCPPGHGVAFSSDYPGGVASSHHP